MSGGLEGMVSDGTRGECERDGEGTGGRGGRGGGIVPNVLALPRQLPLL